MGEGHSADDAPALARTLFGRRKGKKLRSHQSDLIDGRLPQLAIDVSRDCIDPRAMFGAERSELRMEIGFGGAEHLVHEAQAHPHVAYLGCEPFLNGVAKLLVRIEEQGLDNIRVHHGDARDVLTRLEDGALDRVDVLYPDPWPKWRQRKRRFLSDANLVEIARVLKPGGRLRFATDIDDYAGWVLARVARLSDLVWEEGAGLRDWRAPWPNWPGTRYEAKAFREGRPPVYLTFRRI